MAPVLAPPRPTDSGDPHSCHSTQPLCPCSQQGSPPCSQGGELGGRREGTGVQGPGADAASAPTWSSGDQSEHRVALKNIASMVRPGGVLVIDHRNYDHILSTGCAPPGKNIYYKVGLPGEVLSGVQAPERRQRLRSPSLRVPVCRVT